MNKNNLFDKLKKNIAPSKEEVINPNQINGEDDYVKELLKEKEVLFKPSTKRNCQLATKLAQEDYDLINYIAKKKHWMLVEVLENSIRLMARKIQQEENK